MAFFNFHDFLGRARSHHLRMGDINPRTGICRHQHLFQICNGGIQREYCRIWRRPICKTGDILQRYLHSNACIRSADHCRLGDLCHRAFPIKKRTSDTARTAPCRKPQHSLLARTLGDILRISRRLSRNVRSSVPVYGVGSYADFDV